MKVKNSLLKRCQECMVNPIADILENFSLEKSKFHYEKYAKQWNDGDYQGNPADKVERETFPYGSLNDLSIVATEAQNLYANMKKADFIRGLDWRTHGQNIIVGWHRLKTFDEWLHDGLKDAITQHYKDPEGGIRRMLTKEWGGGLYGNVDIHLWLEGKIDDEAIQRMGRYEPNQPIADRDVEKDIEEAIKALGAREKKGEVTVLTLKV